MTIATDELAGPSPQALFSSQGAQAAKAPGREKGVVQRCAAVLKREALGLDLLCVILIMLAHHRVDSGQRFREGVLAMPEVLECHYLTGEFDCLVKVVVANHEELQRFVERLMKVGGANRLRTAVVLNEIKSTTALPLKG